MNRIIWGLIAATFSLLGYQKHLDYLHPSKDYTFQGSLAYERDENLLVTLIEYRPNQKMVILYPQLSGLPDKNSENHINRTIKKLFTQDALTQNVHADLKNIECYWCEGSVKKINNLLIVTRNDYVRSFGAAHGMPGVTMFHIDSLTGQHYSLQDLFKENTDFKEQLIPLVKKKIAQEFPHVTQEHLPLDGFIISKTGFKIFFQPYQIDCFAAGFPAIKIYYNEIDSLLNKTGSFYQSFTENRLQSTFGSSFIKKLFGNMRDRLGNFFHHVFGSFIIT